MKVIDEHTILLNKQKEYEVETSKGIIKIRKWWKEDEISGEYDCDFEYVDSNSELVSTMLDEDEYDDLLVLVREFE